MSRPFTDRVRDNQWWYSHHPSSGQLDGIEDIVLVVNGRRCTMRHAAVGRDGRITRSFRFTSDLDRDAWVRLRGQLVTVDVELDAAPTDAPRAEPALRSDASRPVPLPEPDAIPAPITLEIPMAAQGDVGRIFGAYLFCDWSASSQPKTGPDSIWFADCWFDDTGSLRPGVLENPPTRAAAEKAIRDRVLFHRRDGRRTLVGFDFPFGYPAASLTGVVDKPRATWRDLWKMLAASITDDASNGNNRFEVADAINARLRESWYWGTPHAFAHLQPAKIDRGEVKEFRLVEESLRKEGRRPFSVWQLFGNGSVGSQSLVGLPVCERLRSDEALGLRVWPFETGFEAPGRHSTFSILAEVWPGAISVDLALHPVRDAAQVLSLVKWAAGSDQAGVLAEAFRAPNLIGPTREVAERVEGWILGHPLPADEEH